MEKLEKFMNELKETLNYAENATIFSEEWAEENNYKLYRILIFNISVLFTETIEVLAKWKIAELARKRNNKNEDVYEIFIGFLNK